MNVVTAVQHGLLPRGLPVLPNARLGALYVLGDVATAGGGDWYDAIVLYDGRAALVVGDVVGHGVAASVAMAQLRWVLRDRIGDHGADTGDVAAALRALDRMAGHVPGALGATVCLAVLDPADGSVSYCTAGHPPPLVVAADGRTRFLPPAGAGPLGTGTTFVVRGARLDEDELLLLFSDGLIERHGRDYASGLAEVAGIMGDAVLACGHRPDERPAVDHVLDLAVPARAGADDLTLLVAQRAARPAALRLDLPADIDAVALSYRATDRWLARLNVGERDVTAVRHAVCEAVTNCVEHAYIDQARPGPVHLRADIDRRGVVRIEVTDEGRWREHDPGISDRDGGLGLVIAEHVVDDLRVLPTATGTTVTITHAVTTPVRWPVPDADAPGVPAPALLLVLPQHGTAEPRVRVDGPVTNATAVRLAAELQRLSRNGTRPLVVDLTGVTVLGSAGIVVLHRAIRRYGDRRAWLRLFAPPGSPAQQTLALTALPHLTIDPHAGGEQA